VGQKSLSFALYKLNGESSALVFVVYLWYLRHNFAVGGSGHETPRDIEAEPSSIAYTQPGTALAQLGLEEEQQILLI